MWTLLITLVWAQAPSPDAACALPPVPSAVLAGSIADATGAFAGLDLDGFEDRAEAVWKQLPCVSEPLTPLEVADVYKLRALDAFLAQDDLTMRQSLRSMHDTAPDYALPPTIAPHGHPLQKAMEEAANAPASPRSDLPVPNEARLLVDGEPILTRPDRPVLMQLLTMNGGVEWTHLLPEDTPPPAYETLDEDFRDRYLSQAKVIRVRQRRPVELVVASGAALLGASAMYGISHSSRASFRDPGTPYEDLAGLRARTNGLQTAAVITGLAGLGLGATAIVTW